MKLVSKGELKVDKVAAIKKLREDVNKLSAHCVQLLFRGILVPILLGTLVIVTPIYFLISVFGGFAILMIPILLLSIPATFAIYLFGCSLMGRNSRIAINAFEDTWIRLRKAVSRLDTVTYKVDVNDNW